MALTKTQISELYVAIFNRASEGEGNEFWISKDKTAAATADEMLATDAAKTYFGTSMDDNAAFIEMIYANTLNKAGATVDADGKAGWVAKLAAGESRGEVVSQLVAAVATYKDSTDPVTKAAYDQFTNRVDVSNHMADTAYKAPTNLTETTFGTGALDVTNSASSVVIAKNTVNTMANDAPAPVVPGKDFVLTTTQDNITGTDDSDTFYAYASQNMFGAVTNTLSTGDMIDGGKGTADKIISSMINDETVNSALDFAPMPIIKNVEEIRIQALENGVNATDVVILDADQITGENHYASDSSRADLVITNVDITSTQITNDILLEMKNTQQNSDLAVYFDEQSLVAKPAQTTASAQVILQVADGAQVTGTLTPLANMTFDLKFTQEGVEHSFDNIASTDGTYAGLVLAIEVALASKGLTTYTVALGDTFDTFTTGAGKSVNLDYTGSYVTITSTNGTPFSDITFAPQQKAGTDVAILLAQSSVNANATTVTNMVESTIILDNVGRGSNGGEVIIGSTSASKSSTGVERINVIVREDSVVHDISTTNDDGRASWKGLQEITLTNDANFKGDFVLTNADYTTTADIYKNVKEDNFKIGLEKFTATNFDGNIVLGRDNDIVNLGELSAAVNGNVTYNATLNDNDTYKVTTGNGADTINITLNDSRLDANTDTDTAVTINTGAGNDIIIVNEDNASLENTTATIDAGAGNDVIHGNDVSVTVTAGAGNDVVYAENTGDKALLNIATSGLFGAVTPATDIAAPIHPAGAEIHLLAGKQVQVTIAVDGLAAGLLTNGYESDVVTIEASSGALTTLADLNNAVLKAINEDTKLNKIATAYVDENNNVAIKYLVDGTQVAGAVSLKITDPVVAPTSVPAAMLNAYRDLINDSTYTSGTLLTNWNTVAAKTTASTATHEGSTITITAFGTTGDTVTFYIGDDSVSYTATGVIATDADALADALIAAGYYAESDGTDTVSVITDKEVLLTDSGDVSGTPTTAATITNDVTTLDETDIAMLLGDNSVNNDNENVVNGGSGDDVIVLSSHPTPIAAGAVADTVVWTGYNQGNDTIVHFDTTLDKLDFTAYLTGTVDAGALGGSGSSSAESEVTLPSGIAVANDTFTANSINLIQFNALDAVTATQTFESLTEAQLAAALNADATANTAASTNGIYQSKATSVLIIEDAVNANGPVAGDLDNAGTYKAYEVTYNDATVAAAAGGTAGTYTVKFIGQFDLGDDVLAVGDLTQLA